MTVSTSPKSSGLPPQLLEKCLDLSKIFAEKKDGQFKLEINLGTSNFVCSIEHSPAKQTGSPSQLETQKKVKKKSPSTKRRDFLRIQKFLENRRRSLPMKSTSNDPLQARESLDYSVISEIPLSEEIPLEETEKSLDEEISETKPAFEKSILDPMDIDETSSPVTKPCKIVIEPIKDLLKLPPPAITYQIDLVVCSKNKEQAQSNVRDLYDKLTQSQTFPKPMYIGPQISNKTHHFIFSLILTKKQYNLYKIQKKIDGMSEIWNVILSRIDNVTVKPEKQKHCRSCFKKEFKEL